ncbi:MAG TPA: hypothetical protein VKB80_07370 [Kofleriaceae bacterium]|nr:hypothetical protein [Kofleriaceae bacterium]
MLAQLSRALGLNAVLCASGPHDHLRRAADIIVKAPPAGPPRSSMWGS